MLGESFRHIDPTTTPMISGLAQKTPGTYRNLELQTHSHHLDDPLMPFTLLEKSLRKDVPSNGQNCRHVKSPSLNLQTHPTCSPLSESQAVLPTTKRLQHNLKRSGALRRRTQQNFRNCSTTTPVTGATITAESMGNEDSAQIGQGVRQLGR